MAGPEVVERRLSVKILVQELFKDTSDVLS